MEYITFWLRLSVFLLYFLIALSIIKSVNRYGNIFSITGVFLLFIWLNISDFLLIINDVNIINISDKLNAAQLSNPLASVLISLSLNFAFITCIHVYIVKPKQLVSKVESTVSIEKSNTQYSIPSFYYLIAITLTLVASTISLRRIIDKGILAYIYESSGNWILSFFTYSLLSFSIFRSCLYKKIDLVNVFAIFFHYVSLPFGGVFLANIISLISIYNDNISKIGKKVLLLLIPLLVLYPLTKLARSDSITTLYDLLQSYDIKLIWETPMDRSMGASVQIAIIDHFNAHGGFTLFTDFFPRIITVFIPRSYWNDKPVVFGANITEMFTSNYYVEGTSIAPSIVGYFYHGIGIFSFILFPFLGKMLNFLDTIEPRVQKNIYFSILKPLTCPLILEITEGSFDNLVFSTMTCLLWFLFWKKLIFKPS